MSSASINWRLAAGERYYPTTVDWSALAALATVPALDAAAAPQLVAGDRYVSASRFDALNRPIQSVMPYAATGGKPSVVQPAYNEAGLPEAVDVWVRAATAPASLLNPATADQHAITRMDYNAHRLLEALDRGNGSHSEYKYDSLTWRVQTVTTTRPDPNPDARTVQALSYTYDPIGNVTRLRDDADLHDVVYFSNQRVDPTLDYTYDPTYRLVRATGREHLGQGGAGALLPSVQTSNDDSARMASAPGVRFINPGDGKAMGNYTETYSYDAVGNFLQMVHQVASGGWTRSYSYQETSQVAPAEISNRLSTTSLPGDAAAGPYSAAYTYDAHGSMTSMPHLPVMTWDEQDRMQSTTRQRKVGGGMPETTFNTYDGSGNRARKRTYAATAADGITPVLRKERIYLGPLEIYREFEADGVTPKLERETLHVLLDHRRVALIETRTLGADPAPLQQVRYQYTNRLGSAALELTSTAEVLSYEEYFPYGATAYQATRNQTDLPKRYRYTGLERDEENDLNYHGARYCAPWIGRWTSTDPMSPLDGPNPFLYAHGNPIMWFDPDGKFNLATYDQFLTGEVNAENTRLAGQKDAVAKKEAGKKDNQTEIANDQAKIATLDAKRSTAMARRKVLEGQKSLTKTEKAELKGLKKENTSLVKQIDALNADVVKRTDANIRLDEKIATGKEAIGKTEAHIKSLNALKSSLDTTYSSVSKARGQGDTDIVTDIVMNEARDSSQTAKLAIAYAYVNFHKGTVELPKTKAEISFFHVGVTEERFANQENKEAYVQQIVNSLGAANSRLGDMANASDPTSGATHWFSPKPIGETKVSPLPSWATEKGVTKIIVPGVDPLRFTFFKGVK